jgi:hypothetical protein
MYKVHIRPVNTYASETWILSKANEWPLSLFERKVLRCIFGAKQENEVWRKIYNYKLYEKFNPLNAELFHLLFANIIRRFNVYGSVHCKYIPIYIQQDATLHSLFIYINKLCNAASCWIYEYIGILFGAHPILRISSIKVNDSNIVNYIKAKRLAWARNFMPMNDNRTLKKINTKLDGVRRVGRPKM